MNIPEMLNGLINLGFTQQGIAVRIGTTQPTINRAINGAGVRYELGKAIENLYVEEFKVERLKTA